MSSIEGGVAALLASQLVAIGVPVCYSRVTIAARAGEPFWLRCGCGVALAAHAVLVFGSAPGWPSFAAASAAHLASYAACISHPQRVIAMLLSVAALLYSPLPPLLDILNASRVPQEQLCLAAVAFSALALVLALSQLVARAGIYKAGFFGVAIAVVCSPPVACQLLPIAEFKATYDIAGAFYASGAGGAGDLHAAAASLALTTVHVQLPIGHLGVAYLRAAQGRKNSLYDVGNGKESAAAFARAVGSFMLRWGAPYLLQRSCLESINDMAAKGFFDRVENSLRLDPSIAGGAALSVLASSNFTLDEHVSALRGSAEAAFSLLERKLFSLPKLALVPSVLAAHPRLALGSLPLLVAVDVFKAKAAGALSGRVEEYNREARRLASARARIEAHDAQNAGLLTSAAADGFTTAHWAQLTARVQSAQRRGALLGGLRQWLDWLYWQDILTPSIEVGLAFLLARKHIGIADLWLFSRVVEDTVDTLLMRSRAEAKLSRVRADVLKLQTLLAQIRHATALPPLLCTFNADIGKGPTAARGDASAPAGLSVRAAYERGSASVNIDALELPPRGIFAIAGKNGCGKSTLLSILLACARSAPPPHGVDFATPPSIALPSSDAAIVTQRHYCPLYARPVDWLATGSALVAREAQSEGGAHRLAMRAARLASELHFSAESPDAIAAAWMRTHDDYCASLSGGQRSKFELLRSVFLRPSCPPVLLLDEAFAALDPLSKTLVMRKVRAHCAASLALVTYHADPDDARADADEELCAVGKRFFDGIIRFGADGNVSALIPCAA